MRHQKLTALLLAAALTAGLCAGTVLAGGDEPDPQAGSSQDLLISPAPSGGLLISPAPGGEQPAPDDTPAVDLPGEEGAPRTSIIAEGQSFTQDAAVEEAAGTLSFQNVAPRIRANNLNYLALEESIKSIKAVDYQEMKDSLNRGIRLIKVQQKQMEQLVAGTQAAIEGLKAAGTDLSSLAPALTAYPQGTIYSLSTQVSSLEATLDDLNNGVIQDEYSAAVRQLTNAQNQIVLGGQTLYISLLGLDQTAQSLQRQLASLDRTLEELELRYNMGQISALTLAEAKAGRTSLVSGIQTLDMNRTALKRQLEAMVGLEITGSLQLQPLTAVTAEQLAALDLEQDLKQAMEESYDLFAARKAVYDADDDLLAVSGNSSAADYELDVAAYAAQAAELSLDAAEQTYELGFRTLYDTVHDQKQVLAAARTALAVKEDNLAAARLKYQQGTLSRNALLSAQDARDDAQDTADTAAVDLFTSYNNYRWAVEHGILN